MVACQRIQVNGEGPLDGSPNKVDEGARLVSVRLRECVIVSFTVNIENDSGWVAFSHEEKIHHETRRSAISVSERMDMNHLMMHTSGKFWGRHRVANGMMPSKEFTYEPLHLQCLWRDVNGSQNADIVLSESSCFLIVNVLEYQTMEVEYHAVTKVEFRSDKTLQFGDCFRMV